MYIIIIIIIIISSQIFFRLHWKMTQSEVAIMTFLAQTLLLRHSDLSFQTTSALKGWLIRGKVSFLRMENNNMVGLQVRINISIWVTAHLPLP